MIRQKICVIGNGLTGLTAALILSKLDIDIHLIGDFKSIKKFSDNRTTAISSSNYNFLIKYLKKKDSKFFWPSTKIDLYYEEKDKILNFLNFEKDGKPIMYTIHNLKLRKIILEKIKSDRKIKIINTHVKEIDQENSTINLQGKSINYDSILLCVGRKSPMVKKLIGTRAVNHNYNEVAFTSIIKHKLNITNSQQYFFKEGPLAILPTNKKEFSLIWSVNKHYSSGVMKNLIRKKINKILGSSGDFKISKIDFFPISFNLNTNFIKKNILVLGEGSYNIHPVAGQGFNLILRDLKELYQEIEKQIYLGMQIKDSIVFYKFMLSRKPENLLFGIGINFIHKFFKNNIIAAPIKKIILKDINKFNFLKNLNLKIADSGIFK